MTINAKGVEVGDFVRITKPVYSTFTVGNYYEVVSLYGTNGIGLLNDNNEDDDFKYRGNSGWTFSYDEFDDIRKKDSPIKVGDKVRVIASQEQLQGIYAEDVISGETYEVKSVYSSGCDVGEGLVNSVEFDMVELVEDTPQTFPSLSNKKIWVKGLTEEQKKAIQDVAFKLGYKWGGDFRSEYHNFSESVHVYYFDTFVDGQMEFDFTVSEESFQSTQAEEITYEELFGIPKKVVKGASQPYSSAMETIITLPDIQTMCAEADVLIEVKEDAFVVISEDRCDGVDDQSLEVYSVESLIETLEDITTIRKLSAKLGWS